jgi:outer membrane protein TolC
LNAFYDFTGYSDQNLPFGSSTNHLFNSSWDDLERRPANRGVTFTLSIPVWDWGVNKAEVSSAQVNVRRNELLLDEQKKEIITSITDAVRQVRTAESRLEVLKKSQEVAQRTYEISLERFDTGVITSQLLALDNKSLSDAKLAYLGAFISYQMAIADLKRKTLWDFVNDRSLR